MSYARGSHLEALQSGTHKRPREASGPETVRAIKWTAALTLERHRPALDELHTDRLAHCRITKCIGCKRSCMLGEVDRYSRSLLDGRAHSDELTQTSAPIRTHQN